MTNRSKTSIAFLLLLFTICFYWSCRNTADQTATDSTGTAPTQVNSTSPDTLAKREKLVKALQQLQHDMAGKDKEAIAAYFRFPVQSDALQAFDVGEGFTQAVEQNGHLVSRQIFLTHFTALYSNLEMQGFDDLFAQVPLADLKDTANNEVKAEKADGVCMHFYNIAIAGQEVTLQFGVYTNEAYTSQHPNEEMECAEYAAFWTFVFDGEKLVFDRHQVAG